MAINFPASPSAGQKFTSGKTMYTFTNGAWRPAPLGTALPKNYLINPAMSVSQQNGNTLVGGLTASALAYPADQWLLCISCDPGTASTQRIQAITPSGSADRIRSTVTSGTVVSSLQGDYYFQQRLEGFRVADLLWGTAAAKQVILRFGFKAPAGTYSALIRNTHPTAARTYLATFTITAGQANIDTIQTFVIPGDTTGTWAKDATIGMTVIIQMAGGGALGAGNSAGWKAGNFGYLTGQINGAKTTGWVYDLFDVGLYADPNLTGIAPPWGYVPTRQAIFDSQRYWQKCYGALGIGIAATTTHQRASYPNQAPMRIAPVSALVGAMRAWEPAAVPNITAIANNYANTYVNEFNFTSSAAQTTGRGVMLIDTSATIYIAENARL